ncbi:MAG: hypothetical protein K5739_00480 [Lachnospiraceae bacterium]|nr:hypothetical protein [Lachnospiraceae bacterium]
MTEERKARDELVKQYAPSVEKLSAYLPWLMEKSGASASTDYTPEGGKTITFPVYDSMLLKFIKDAESTCFINRNYPYVYSRNRIRTEADELRFIEGVDIMNIADLGGILSRYVIEGRTKGVMWSKGVTGGVYLRVIEKARDLIEFYSRKQ